MSAVLDQPTLRRHAGPRRAPGKQGGFSWGRFPIEPEYGGGVRYCLFRREAVSGRLHMESRSFGPFAFRKDMARQLWAMRVRLREAVDALDLKAMGLL